MNTILSSCILCYSEKIIPMRNFQNAFLAKCANCGFVFSYKNPSETELINHYSNYPSLNRISKITINRYNELLDKFEKFRKNNTIMDVGCGDGFFLEEAKKRNWNVYGTEYRKDAIQKCITKGIIMQQGKLAALNFTHDFFDVITSFEVIEHINNPNEEIPTFNKLLRPGGLVYLTTPNFNSLSRYLLGSKWNIIEYPEHLSYYTMISLKTAFSSYGFTRIDYEVTGVSISRFMKSIKKNPDSHVLPLHDDVLRDEIEKNKLLSFLKKVINLLLTITKTGDTLKIWLRKTDSNTVFSIAGINNK